MQNKSAAQETIAELDSMESNLRRLGLGADSASDPVCGKSGEATEAYLARIRAAKDERRRLKHEKELRQFMASAKESDNEKYLSRVAEAKRVQNIVDGAPDLLKEENMRAVASMKARVLQDASNDQRAEQLRKGQELQQELLVERSKADRPTYPLPSAADCHPQSFAALSGGGDSVKSALVTTMHHDDAIDFCEALAYGLADLSILVSDNRHLPEPDLSGEPVQRLVQDLGVTQWNRWVQQCLHPLSTSPNGEDGTEEGASLTTRTIGSPSSPRRAADAEAALHERILTELCDLAKDHVSAVAQRDAARSDHVGQTAVIEALATFLQENERVHKLACEAIRREYVDDDGATDGGEHETGPSTATVASAATRALEEVVPRWSQKMPPAATFLHGDDLSGARLLVEKIEQAARHGIATASGSTGAVEETAPAASAKSAKKSSSQATPTGVVVRDGGLKKIFLTPRCLTGQLAASPGSGGGGGGRTQLSSAGRVRTTGKGTSAGGAGARRASNVNGGDDDERREMELLSDLLTRELLSLHVRNVHALTAGKMPLPPSLANTDTLASAPDAASAVASVKPGAAATSGKAQAASRAATPPHPQEDSAKGTHATATAQPCSLQTLLLVGFPQSDVFYRLLCDKLRAQIDVLELEMLTEERRLVSLETDGTSAAANSSSPSGKGKAPHPPSRPKSSKAANAKGSAASAPLQPRLSDTSNTLLRSKVFPPLCICGFFLQYTLPTRHMRLQDASVRIGSDCGGANGQCGTDSTPSAATTTATANAAPSLDAFAMVSPAERHAMCALTASQPPPLSHPIFAPVSLFAAAAAPPTVPSSAVSLREAPVAGNAAVPATTGNRDRPSTMHLSLSGSASLPTRGSHTATAPAAVVGELWSTRQMQRELVEQDRRMHAWREAWCDCFARVSAASIRKAAHAVLLGKSARRRSGDKNGTTAAGTNTNLALPSPRKGSHVAGPSGTHDNGGADANGTADTASFTLPKVLFFVHTEDVSGMDQHAERIANELAETEAWQWLGHPTVSASSPLCDDGSGALDVHGARETVEATVEALRTRWAAFLVCRLVDSLQGSARVLVNEALTPHQLPAPLRLGDLRLPREAQTRLVSTYETFTRHPLTVASRGGHMRSLLASHAAASPRASTCCHHTPLATAAEMDVQRVFSLYIAQSIDVLRAGVFARELWLPPQARQPQLTTVARYATIDQDYETAKLTLLDLTDSSRRRLYTRAAVFMRLVIDAALEATAKALSCLSQTLCTHCGPTAGTQLGDSFPWLPAEAGAAAADGPAALGRFPHLAASASVENSDGARAAVATDSTAGEDVFSQQFLTQLRRLSEGEVQALVSPLFVEESATEASAAVWAALAPYAQEVQRCATACVADALERAAASSDAANTAPATSTTATTPSSAQPRPDWHAVVPAMVACVLSHTFYLPSAQAHSPGVAAPLVRAVVVLQTLVSGLDVAGVGSGEWLEAMYRLAVHVPVGHTYPDSCRPPSVAALLSPPAPAFTTRENAGVSQWMSAVESMERAIADAEEASLVWQQCRVELLLADFSLYNTALLSEEAFVHCAALHQLHDLCWYLESDAGSLAKAVDFSFSDTELLLEEGEAAQWQDVYERHPDVFMGFTLTGDVGPLAPDGPDTIAQLRVAFEKHAELTATTHAGEGPPTAAPHTSPAHTPSSCHACVDVRQWLCDVIRCSAAVEYDERCHRGAPMKRAVHLARPSARELRAVVLTLPHEVVRQATMASAAIDNGESYLTSAAPSTLITAAGLDSSAWGGAHWWCDLAPIHVAAVQWALLRLLTARYVLTPGGVLSTPVPRLPTVLRWLARAACGGAYPHEAPASFLEAVFHCLAALQYRMEVDRQASAATETEAIAVCIDPHAVPPLAVDDVVVRAADFAYFLAAPTIASEAYFSLATDALLLVQATSDGTAGVTLPLLLSSQWGRTLLQRHSLGTSPRVGIMTTAALPTA